VQAPGGEGTFIEVAKEIDSLNFVLHAGDLAYSCGRQWVWEWFMGQIESLSSNVPYMVNIGNHEYDFFPKRLKDTSVDRQNKRISNLLDPAGFSQWNFSMSDYGMDSHGECGVPPFYRFATSPKSGGVGCYWHSFEYNNIHIMVFSTEHNFTEGSPQRIWMDNDLLKVNRTKTPWLLVSGHRPFYDLQVAKIESQPLNFSTDPTNRKSKEAYPISLFLQKTLEDTFNKYKVNAYLGGHFHAYVRTCPIFKTNVVDYTTPECTPYNAPKGIVSLTAGNGGAILQNRTFLSTPFPWVDKFYQQSSRATGFLRVNVNASHMHFQLVANPIGKNNKTDSRQAGVIMDDFTLAQRVDLNA